MADNLTWVKLKNGQTKQIATRIALDKNYQAQMGFKLLDGSPEPDNAIDTQKKITGKAEPKKDAAETNDDSQGENSNDDLGAGVETEDLSGPQETGKTGPAAKKETVEETIIRLHKAGKKEHEIKTETGINMNTIRKVINKIK